MKISKGFIATAAILAAVALFVWNRIERINNSLTTTDEGAREWMLTHHQHQAVTNSPAPQPSPSSNRIPHALGLREGVAEMTEVEKAAMTNLFRTKLKPSVEKWAKVYGNRVPFNLADLGMDKFVEQIGRDSKTYHSYTFVVGDITLGITQQNGDTQVQYLASKSELQTLQALPTTGAAPDLSIPVTPQDVLQMAEADSGQQLPRNLVQLIPSAESGSMAGGAIVNVGNQVKNAMGIPISNVSAGFNYVFAKSGSLAFYLRH